MTRFFPAAITMVLFLSACRENKSPLFIKMDASETGIGFKNTLEESEAANVLKYSYFYNGGGVAIGDINNDGLQDILFTGNMVSNRLYLNKGNFKFEDITAGSGISKSQGWCTGATITDINADGRPDIYICRSADAMPEKRKNLLYINNGDLTFTEQAAQYGLADAGYSSQAAFFDYDKDSDLDMFLINHSLQQYANEGLENPTVRKNRQPAFACKLYRNNNGHYTDISTEAGIVSNVLTFGLGLALSDFNNDNWPDVYVSNDFNEPDYLFVNTQNGTFTERLADCMDEVSLFSMGSDAADYNNDGLTDLITLDMLQDDNRGQKMHNGAENFDKFQMLYKNGLYFQSSRNMLHTNNGDGTFSETGQFAGISASDWSWSALFCDYDNDGLKDLLITNGYAKDYTDMDFIKYSMNRTLKERRGEKTEPVTDYIAKMPSIIKENYLYKNNGNNSFSKSNNSWGLQEENISSGAAYADLDNDGDMDIIINNINEQAGIYRNNLPRSNFLKIQLKGEKQNTAGIGAKIKLYCKDDIFYHEHFPVRGFQSSVDPVTNIGLGKHTTIDSVLITYPDDKIQKFINVKAGQRLVADQKNAHQALAAQPKPSTLFSRDTVFTFLHTENDFNDFTVQPLIPNFLSHSGPRITKTNANIGRLDDIRIDTTTNVCIKENGNYRFVGNRSIPGKYPMPPTSYLFLKDTKGNFTATDSISPGMITDAAWIDINGDTVKELVIVGEWMPIMVYKVENGKLEDISESCIKFPSNGWWNKIYGDDMDNDGDEDLIIGNAGLNTQFKVSVKEPFTLVYSDFDNNGSIDPILCYYIDGVSYPMASRDDLTDQLPFLRKKFLEYHTYANATLTDIFTSDQLKDAKTLRAEYMSTVYLENKGAKGFVKRELPREAQYSPVYAITSIDADKDGKKDLVLAGNNTWTRVKFGRYRANHGVVLKGDGKANFTYIPQHKSGLNLRDNIRSMITVNDHLIIGVNNKPVITYKRN